MVTARPLPKPVADTLAAVALPVPEPAPRYELTVEGPSGTSKVKVGILPQRAVVLEAPVKITLDLDPVQARLDCDPWQIVSVDGVNIGRSPVALPGTEKWPVKIGLKKPPGSQRLEFKLSIRSLDGP